MGRLRIDRLELLSALHASVDPIQLGFSHREDYAQQRLGISNRSWQEQVRIGRQLASLPATRAAYANGLITEAKLTIVLGQLTPENERSWLRRAARLGPDALRRVVGQARENTDRQASRATAVSRTTDRELAVELAPEVDAEVGAEVGANRSVGADRSRDANPSSHLDSEASRALRIRCPYPTVWSCQSFAEIVSRRIGHRASSQDYLDVALASFLAGQDPRIEANLSRHVHWPPLFVTESDPRSHNVSPTAPSHDKQPELDSYVYTFDGKDIESPGPWLSFRQREAAERKITKPEAGDPGWAYHNGIPDDQTDGGSFVMSRPERVETRQGMWSEHHREREMSLAKKLRARLEELLSERHPRSRLSCSEDRYPAEQPNEDSALPQDADPCPDPLVALQQLHELEAESRVLKRQRLDCLRQIRKDRSFVRLGFVSFDDYVEARLGRTARTAHRWLRAPEVTRTLRSAESDPRLRTPFIRQLQRIECAGAEESTLRLWVERALSTPLKGFKKQIDWTLAHDDLRPKNTSFRSQPRLQPPDAALWPEVLGRMQTDPHALSSETFHRKVRDVEALLAERPAVVRKSIDRSPTSGDKSNPTSSAHPELPDGPTFSAHHDQPDESTFSERHKLPDEPTFSAHPELPDGPTSSAHHELPDEPTSSAHTELPGELTSSAHPELPDELTSSAHPELPDELTSSAHPELPRELTSSAHPDPVADADASKAPTFSARASRLEALLNEDSTPPSVPIPDPTTPTETHLRFFVAPETIDALARAFAILRAQYGQDKPDWWCLEVLFIHVQAGWIDEDADFRRRTAEFRTLARDGFQCQNPYCTSRRNLTVHHIIFRSANGSDDGWNKITLCAACHLQGVHSVGSIRVSGKAPGNLVWKLGRDGWETTVEARGPELCDAQLPGSAAPRSPALYSPSFDSSDDGFSGGTMTAPVPFN